MKEKVEVVEATLVVAVELNMPPVFDRRRGWEVWEVWGTSPTDAF